ncbi:Gfo/Idh/MocA family oxidoreductase [candidate division KSB1 bacterium]|nr:Gfo/Idh/MocA family oxidoreductase [candidate division KSB1 bacterium]
MQSKDEKMTRRTFMKQTATVAAATMAAPMFIPKSVFGANDRIRIAVLGVNGRGRNHVESFMELQDKNVIVTTLCDPDMEVLKKRGKEFEEKYQKKVNLVQDLRRVFDDKKVDAVSIASTNHWHSLSTIWACQEGKDVYVEKPMSHNVFEGRKAVEAARKYNRIVQHGTQQRSSESRTNEIAAVQSGKYGKLLVSKGYASKPRWTIGYKAPKAPPAHLDYNLWLGPALDQPYHENLVHYNWHWFWDMGNGEIGNQGVHQMDIARWAIKDATLPTKVWSLGGRYAYDDQGETANTQMAVMEFGDVLLIFEVTGLVGKTSRYPGKVANEYYTTDGMIYEGKFYPKKGGAPQELDKFETGIKPGNNFENFIYAMRSRKVEDLNADVLDGHYSSALCHLPNISLRLGQPMPFGKVPEGLLENEVVYDTFANLQKNLSWGNKLKFDELTYQMGRVLTFDPVQEKFVDDEEANTHISRPYRKPFVVSDLV